MIILNFSDFYSGIFHLPKKIPADGELHVFFICV